MKESFFYFKSTNRKDDTASSFGASYTFGKSMNRKRYEFAITGLQVPSFGAGIEKIFVYCNMMKKDETLTISKDEFVCENGKCVLKRPSEYFDIRKMPEVILISIFNKDGNLCTFGNGVSKVALHIRKKE